MTYALAAALVLAVCGYPLVVWLFLRHSTQQALDASVERAQLCQRIQAPEAAVLAYSVEHLPDQPQVPVYADEDKSWWASQGFDQPDPED